jgi:hypothetical protein
MSYTGKVQDGLVVLSRSTAAFALTISALLNRYIAKSVKLH